MNEYARLARDKHPSSRSTPELVAACFGTDEEKSKLIAESLEGEPEFSGCEKFLMCAKLPKASVRLFTEFLSELRHRRTPSELVKESFPVIQSVNDIVSQVSEYRDKKKEYLLAFFLNARHQLIAKEIVSIGTLTASLAHPREIFSPAIGKAAAGVILCHNHPSGDPSPSEEDMRLTKRIAQAGMILGIDLLDHLIVASQGCYSFKASGSL